ncbi:hypothetical protein Droror1_Dr00011476 [Drosera rotundifolia]
MKKHKKSTHSSQNGAHTIPTTSSPPNSSKNPNHRLTRSTRWNPKPSPESDAADTSDLDLDSDSEEEYERKHQKARVEETRSLSRDRGYEFEANVASLHVNAEKERSRKVASARDVTTSGKGIGPATPLPDKALLVLILDKLQKKDKRRVFAKPVDPKELPDYLDIVENPMDFSTIRNKLDGGLYFSLEQLEADVYLICTNAMKYNAPSTMFFRQARSIQALAKVEFDKLIQGGDTPEEQPNSDTEPLPKPRRGRPPGSRTKKKSPESSPLDHVAPGFSSIATHATEGDDVSRLSHYNLRNGPSLLKHNYVDESSRVLNVGRIVESRSKSPGSLDFGQRAEKDSSQMASSSKSCRTQFEHKDSRRSAHSQPFLLPTNGNPSAHRTVGEEIQQLVPVELLSHHGYARSLARFAADLGLVARKIASEKIRSILSPGVEFGPGWVGRRVESSARQSIPSEPTSSNTNYTYDTSRVHRPSTSDLYNAFLSDKPSMPGRSGASD